MRVNAISTVEDAAARFHQARASGYVTFIFQHADPKHLLCDNKFVYVSSDQEMCEKIRLIEHDVTVIDEMV